MISNALNYRKSAGFTLIELIIVIIILGILAVTVAPKFIDVSSDARVAVIENTKGQLKSTLKLARAKFFLEGNSEGGSALIDFNGDAVFFFNGYPHVGGLSSPSVGGQDITLLIENIDDFEIVRSGETGLLIEFRLPRSPDPENCKFSYTQATSTVPTVISSETSGC